MGEVKNFKDFGIKPTQQALIGDKIRIDRIFNREIIVYSFRIVDSTQDKGKGNGKCLHMQIELENTKHVVFTGSAVLQEMIQRVPKEDFPFKTKIIKENERYEFS